MKKLNLLSNIIILLGLILGLSACDPKEFDKPGLETAPSVSDLKISVTPKSGENNVWIIKNVSSIVGIPHLSSAGSVTVLDQNTLETYIPFPGKYVYKLTINTNGGSATKTDTLVVLTGDPEVLSTTWYQKIELICGGVNAPEGKTWVVDSSSVGHFGIGPSAANATMWWAAGSLERTGGGAYDDELTLKLTDFTVEMKNNGDSYVNDLYISKVDGFSNPTKIGPGGYRVNYESPAAQWAYTESSEILQFTSNVVVGFYNGAVENKYVITNLTADQMTIAGKESTGNYWNCKLVRKGYETPYVSYTPIVVVTANANEYVADFTVLNLRGLAVTNYTVNFSDGAGSEITSTDAHSATFIHTYIKKGTYDVVFNANLADGSKVTKNVSLKVENNHPSYVPPVEVPFLITYADFDAIKIADLAANGGGTTVTTVPNPSGSFNVAKVVKVNQQWDNAFIQLPNNWRLDLTVPAPQIKAKVYGTAGDVVTCVLEDKDFAEPWNRGVNGLTEDGNKYIIKQSNVWEDVTFDFKGAVSANGQVVSDPASSQSSGYYANIRFFINPGNDGGTYTLYIDDIRGPIVPGMKSLQIK